MDTTPASFQHEKESLENDSPTESSACRDVMKEKTFNLPPVLPFSSGEGLPYAPEGWPNPGDIWTWKVGRRSNKSGYFHDRYLYLPKSLQKPPHKGANFQSKLEVIRFLESNFPNMKIEEFFALFSWKVLSTEAKVVQSLSDSSPVESLESAKDATNEIGVQGKPKRKAPHCNQSIRRSFRLFNVRPRFPPVVQGADDIIDLCSLSEEAEVESTMDLTGTSDSELDQPSSTRGSQPEDSSVAVCNFIDSKERSGMQTASEKSPNVTTTENFDDYLDALEDLFVTPGTETSISEPVVPGTTSENEMTERKKKLSSFLAMDFPSLVSGDNLVEVATLASQLRKDPSISIDQLIKLKLVEEIPLLSEAFLEAQENIEVAEKFFSDLEAKKLKAASLKNDYDELKNKVAHLDAEIEKSSLAIREIDDQILQLQSKRNEMSSAIETMQKRKAELSSSQAMVANSIPAIVDQIKLGNSGKPEWELKKANFTKRVAEIHERFTTLRGLTF